MADVLTLDIADPQILVRYENDPAGFYWHHRVLLFRVDGDIWIALTPGHALVRIKLLDVRHEVLERRAPPLVHLANQVYAHGPEAGAVLTAFCRRARGRRRRGFVPLRRARVRPPSVAPFRALGSGMVATGGCPPEWRPRSLRASEA